MKTPNETFPQSKKKKSSPSSWCVTWLALFQQGQGRLNPLRRLLFGQGCNINPDLVWCYAWEEILVASDFKWHTNTRYWLFISEQQRHKLHGHPLHVQVLPCSSLTCSIWRAWPASDFWNGTSPVFVDDYMNLIHFFICATGRGPTLMFENFSWFPRVWIMKTIHKFVTSPPHWHQMLFWLKCFQCGLTK
jgi:hypothetical protein